MPAARKTSLWPLVVLLAGLFAWGAWEAMLSPITSGGVYPPYSSLRTDPLGAKALYDSLAALPELSVSRLYRERPPLDSDTALLVLGVDSRSWAASPKETLDDYEKLLARGGRLVIAFTPARPSRTPPKSEALQRQWSIRPVYREPSREEDDSAIPKESALSFDAGPQWTALASAAGRDTIVEGRFGAGSVILVADSFPLSNQGLAESSGGERIATILGPARKIVFDENHFGIAESGSVAVLIRKYRLEGALAVLFIVGALFIWRSSTSFLPPRESEIDENLTGKDSREGLAALMRRGIPEKEVLDVCLAEWRRSDSDGPHAERVEAAVEHAVKQWAGRDPVEGYRAASRAVAEKK